MTREPGDDSHAHSPARRTRRRRARGPGFVTLGVGLPGLLHVLNARFGGENPLGSAPDEDNWHHEGLTRAAARAARWSRRAENSLAFHADYLDSYLYNPLWWFDLTNGGGAARFRVVMSSHDDLVRLHFDDLFHPSQVRQTWHRYLAGTVAGLLWIASSDHDDDVRASLAHNLVGASLHALQDFYSHSNWIDEPDRRDRTWFDVPPSERARLSLWTGSYERPDHLGVKPHGDFLYACTIINNLGSFGRGLLRMACHAASPMAGSSLCQALRDCDEAVRHEIPEALRDAVPDWLEDDLVFLKPGINVDSRWLAEVGADTRGIAGLDGETAFTTAYALALRQSCQWLHALGHLMEDGGQADFWEVVKTRGVADRDYKRDTAPWEDLALLPYRFVSAGPYPGSSSLADTDAWYLRLTITTADVAHAGTNADIVPVVDGRRFRPLDHGPSGSVSTPGDRPTLSALQAALGVDDFEAGVTHSYVIGPLPSPPHRVELRNEAPTAGEVLLAALEAVADAIVGVLESIRDFFRFLTGHDADFVDASSQVLDAATLNALPVEGTRALSLRCDGRSEGDFTVEGRVRKTATTGTAANGLPWREYEVAFTRLVCHDESEWDRGSSSDEPFVLGLVLPHGSGEPLVRWRTGPFSGVDSGDTRTIGRTFRVRIPQQFGFLSVAVAVYESDDESSSDRDRLLDRFADQVRAEHEPAEDAFLVTLSEAIASGWRPHHVDAVAFRRGSPRVEVRRYHRHLAPGWVEGGQGLVWNLGLRQVLTAPVPSACECDCPDGDITPAIRLPRFDLDRILRDGVVADVGRHTRPVFPRAVEDLALADGEPEVRWTAELGDVAAGPVIDVRDDVRLPDIVIPEHRRRDDPRVDEPVVVDRDRLRPPPVPLPPRPRFPTPVRPPIDLDDDLRPPR